LFNDYLKRHQNDGDLLGNAICLFNKLTAIYDPYK